MLPTRPPISHTSPLSPSPHKGFDTRSTSIPTQSIHTPSPSPIPLPQAPITQGTSPHEPNPYGQNTHDLNGITSYDHPPGHGQLPDASFSEDDLSVTKAGWGGTVASMDELVTMGPLLSKDSLSDNQRKVSNTEVENGQIDVAGRDRPDEDEGEVGEAERTDIMGENKHVLATLSDGIASVAKTDLSTDINASSFTSVLDATVSDPDMSVDVDVVVDTASLAIATSDVSAVLDDINTTTMPARGS